MQKGFAKGRAAALSLLTPFSLSLSLSSCSAASSSPLDGDLSRNVEQQKETKQVSTISQLFLIFFFLYPSSSLTPAKSRQRDGAKVMRSLGKREKKPEWEEGKHFCHSKGKASACVV
jgi:hypothetical protein